MSNKNEIKNPKFAVAIDHTANHEKSFTYIRLENTKREYAFAEAVLKAAKEENVYCFHILKKSADMYYSIARIYPNGSIEDLESDDISWTLITFDK